MVYGLLLFFTLLAAFFTGEHLNSFVFGVSLAAIGIGVNHWFAFRVNGYNPLLALGMLVLGLSAKIATVATGVIWGVEKELINSPFVFSVTFLVYFHIFIFAYPKLRQLRLSVSRC